MLGQSSNEGFKHVICPREQHQAQEHEENADAGVGLCEIIQGAYEQRRIPNQPRNPFCDAFFRQDRG